MFDLSEVCEAADLYLFGQQVEIWMCFIYLFAYLFQTQWFNKDNDNYVKDSLISSRCNFSEYLIKFGS